mmetsp:Transcript_41231/g.95667  ORF Transcript_41231/g.95667 Transcript_41231/m.95667 type:complete len:203 (+) Transcript_41231:135-743(+)
MDHAGEAEHGEAAVLDLGQLVASTSSGVLAEVEGIKTEVAGGAAALEHGFARHVEPVGDVLDDADDGEDLPEAARGDLEEGLRRDGVGGGLRGQVDDLLHQAAEGREHADAAVLELGLAEPLDVVLLSEPKGIEADIADHRAVEGSGAGEEGDGSRVLLHLEGGGGDLAGASLGEDARGGERLSRRREGRKNNRSPQHVVCV